ncbi:proteinase-activated receptor 1-like [Cheilinus undulatus]|uniref:proteinase-activated receptor 1-like n=1 Tax=Cheilinus undulatus TaxID=241271 RepID=UPI001BD1FED7|nr:proteinase-activated receptor 1-like [Cheilinus undulatus]
MFSTISTNLQSLMLLAVMCACAVSAKKNNGSFSPKTFLYGSPSEEEDLSQYLENYDSTGYIRPVSHLGLNITNSSRKNLSEEARLFLTGPVSKIIIPSFYTVVCLISVPINLCALLVLARRIRPKKPAAIYMLNLACADLLFAMVLPFRISYHFNGNDWIFGPAVCHIVTAAFYWNMYCSILLIALISVDRLLAVVYPINSLSWRSPKNATIACAAMWILSFAGSLHLLFTEQTFSLTELNITTCHDIQHLQHFWVYKTYFITLCVLLFFLPLIVTVVSYTRVIVTLSRGPPGAPGRSRKRRRAIVMALTVLVMFVLCFTPTNVFLLMQQLQFKKGEESSREASDGLYVVYLVFLCLGSLNCLLDPLVYYFGSSQCQRELFSVLRCQRITEGSGSRLSSSDLSRSSSRTLLKSSRKDSSKTNAPLTKMDSIQANPSCQYKKLLV